jgi:hypothetical protein
MSSRARDPDCVRQHRQHAAAAHLAEIEMRVADPRRLRGDGEIAGQQRFQTAGDRDAVDQGDDGLGSGRHGRDRRMPIVEKNRERHRIALQRHVLLHVAAGTERLAAAGNRQHAHSRIAAKIIDGGAHFPDRLVIDRIHLLRPIERDQAEQGAVIANRQSLASNRLGLFCHRKIDYQFDFRLIGRFSDAVKPVTRAR